MHEGVEFMEVGPYLERICYTGSLEPCFETLKELHKAHMFAVPFENLDVSSGRPIVLSYPSLYDKIVLRHRGGFCYELNGLFGWLLEQLGFDVEMVSARVIHNAQPGPEFDHMVLLLKTEDRLIADVGFGDSFLEPLWLASDREVEQHASTYRLVGPEYERALQTLRDSAWESQYIISPQPRRFDEFKPMCRFHQTSPESTFTQKTVCSVATANGRTTLSNGSLILTTGGSREEFEISGEEEYRSLLKAHFGIEFGAGLVVQGLVAPGSRAP